MSKSNSLPQSLKTLVLSPTFRRGARVGRAAGPAPSPRGEILTNLFDRIEKDAKSRGFGHGEWLSIATATLFTLNSPKSLQSLQRYSSPTSLSLQERVDRHCLIREVGLKCIGFIGIPKVINNLAAIRSVVEEDSELTSALPTEPRRRITKEMLEKTQSAAYELWDDIYQPHSKKLLQILGKSHPDLPVFIVESEYGPLFQSPSTFHSSSSAQQDPAWEVNRLRTSLVAISALRAQGGVGPQVTSHVWGLLKASPSIAETDPHRKGLQWLTSQEGAEWALRKVDEICATVEGAEQDELDSGRESKL